MCTRIIYFQDKVRKISLYFPKYIVTIMELGENFPRDTKMSSKQQVVEVSLHIYILYSIQWCC